MFRRLTSLATRLRRLRFSRSQASSLIVLLCLILIRVWDPGPIEAMRLRFFDLFQQAAPRTEASHPVAIIDIDERSLAELGQWPWPRTVVANIVNRLVDDGAVVVGFDIVFAEPDRTSPVELARLLSLPPSDLMRTLRQLPTNDETLAKSFSRGRIVLGEAALSASEATPATPRGKSTSIAKLGGDPLPYLPKYARLVQNLDELANAAAGRGSFSLAADVDGIVRRVPTVARVGDTIVPSLIIEVLRVASGQKTITLRVNEAGIAAVIVAGVAIPTDENGMIYVHYGPHDPARFVSAADVAAGRVPPGRFAGRIVMIGTSAAGLRDLRATPVAEAMPGVEVHAQVIETVLSGTYLVRPNYALGAELAVITAGGILLIILVPLLGTAWTLGLHIVATISLIGGSWIAFFSSFYLFDWSYPVVAGTLIYILLVYGKYIAVERQRREVSQAFKQYLSPVLVERLARNPERLQLGGELRTMTVMFTDIRGFTSISERLRDQPQRVTTLLNRLLTPLTEAVLTHQGTIDKYIGDGLMALWNAPLDDEAHAIRACNAALSMFDVLERLNRELLSDAGVLADPKLLPGPQLERPLHFWQPIAEKQGVIVFDIGIGINTGSCVVGNMGSTHRFNYSALGDAVNLASRLESLSKTYGVGVIFSEATRRLAPEMAALELDVVTVKGRTEAVRIYGLLGDEKLATNPSFRELVTSHELLLTAYRNRRWDEAGMLADQCRGQKPGLSRLYNLYCRRIADFRIDPPAPEWDGVFVLDTK
ncbi:MAG: CHASE2 domain-containing protein [Aestuariivirga sp.]